MSALALVAEAGPQGLLRRIDVEMLRRALGLPAPEGPVDAYHQHLAEHVRRRQDRTQPPPASSSPDSGERSRASLG